MSKTALLVTPERTARSTSATPEIVWVRASISARVGEVVLYSARTRIGALAPAPNPLLNRSKAFRSVVEDACVPPLGRPS